MKHPIGRFRVILCLQINLERFVIFLIFFNLETSCFSYIFRLNFTLYDSKMFIIISIILTHAFLISTVWFLLHAFLHFWSNLSSLFNFCWLLQDYENISHIYIYWNWLIITENKFHIVYVNNDKIGYLSSKKWKIFLIDSYVSYYCF